MAVTIQVIGIFKGGHFTNLRGIGAYGNGILWITRFTNGITEVKLVRTDQTRRLRVRLDRHFKPLILDHVVGPDDRDTIDIYVNALRNPLKIHAPYLKLSCEPNGDHAD